MNILLFWNLVLSNLLKFVSFGREPLYAGISSINLSALRASELTGDETEKWWFRYIDRDVNKYHR